MCWSDFLEWQFASLLQSSFDLPFSNIQISAIYSGFFLCIYILFQVFIRSSFIWSWNPLHCSQFTLMSYSFIIWCTLQNWTPMLFGFHTSIIVVVKGLSIMNWVFTRISGYNQRFRVTVFSATISFRVNNIIES